MDNTCRLFNCNICIKKYSSYKSLWNHNKKYHNTNVSNIGQNVSNIGQNVSKKNISSLNCKFCNKIFSTAQNRWKHENKVCKKKFNENNKIELLENKIKELENNIKDLPINNQLINIISDKNKKIEELKNQNLIENQQNIKEVNKTIIEKQIKTFESLTLNNIVITSRSDNNYINATQLCQAGGKQFNDWFRLNTTKQLINEAESETGISVSQLIDIKKGNSSEFNQGSWIHPDLAIQLAQWLSPKFALQISKWIRQLFTNGKVEITTKLITDNKLKDQKIKLLKILILKNINVKIIQIKM